MSVSDVDASNKNNYNEDSQLHVNYLILCSKSEFNHGNHGGLDPTLTFIACQSLDWAEQ